MKPAATVDTKKLIEIAKRHKITYLALFGSFSRGDASPDSDIDLIARFLNQHELGFLQLMSIQQEMEDAVGRTVQLLTEEEIHHYIKERIDRERIVLLDQEEERV
jgi:uncharacterized protein